MDKCSCGLRTYHRINADCLLTRRKSTDELYHLQWCFSHKYKNTKGLVLVKTKRYVFKRAENAEKVWTEEMKAEAQTAKLEERRKTKRDRNHWRARKTRARTAKERERSPSSSSGSYGPEEEAMLRELDLWYL